MSYRICKTFEVESGHLLSKHPGKCRFPHGHSRRIEVVLAADTLDERDMVCDFKALKQLAADFVERWTTPSPSTPPTRRPRRSNRPTANASWFSPRPTPRAR